MSLKGLVLALVTGALLVAVPAFTQPVFECVSTVNNTKVGGALSCLATGDWIIVATCGNMGTANGVTALKGWVSCPAGFYAPTNGFAGPTINNTQGMQVCFRIAGANDTTSSTFTTVWNGTGNSSPQTFSLDYRGGSNLLDGATSANGNSTNVTAPAIATGLADDTLLSLYCANGGKTFSGFPAGTQTSRFNSGNSGNQTFAGSDQTIVTASSVAASTITILSADSEMGLSFAFGGNSTFTRWGFLSVP